MYFFRSQLNITVKNCVFFYFTADVIHVQVQVQLDQVVERELRVVGVEGFAVADRGE